MIESIAKVVKTKKTFHFIIKNKRLIIFKVFQKHKKKIAILPSIKKL